MCFGSSTPAAAAAAPVQPLLTAAEISGTDAAVKYPVAKPNDPSTSTVPKTSVPLITQGTGLNIPA